MVLFLSYFKFKAQSKLHFEKFMRLRVDKCVFILAAYRLHDKKKVLGYEIQPLRLINIFTFTLLFGKLFEKNLTSIR